MQETRTGADPSHIMQIAFGFWPSKVLLTAVSAGLFTRLAQKSLSLTDIKEASGWGCTDRHTSDFLDILVALKFLERKGTGDTGIYSNTSVTNFFLDKNKQSYIGGMLEMANNRLFRSLANKFDFTIDDFTKWAKKVGFKKVDLMPLAGPTSAAIAWK